MKNQIVLSELLHSQVDSTFTYTSFTYQLTGLHDVSTQGSIRYHSRARTDYRLCAVETPFPSDADCHILV